MPVVILILVMVLSGSIGATKQATVEKRPSELSEQSRTCIECHGTDNVSIYQQWGASKHYGANVGCYECHRAEKADRDAFDHHGFQISILVSPVDCGRCHPREMEEFVNSHHSKAGRIMGSLDNLLAEVVEGNTAMKTEAFPTGISAAAVNGCWQCHGSEVMVLKNGKLDPATWPNTGMGRINPDGSEGSCSACHSRHEFSVAQARQPENCGKCHMGPDHPQIEIYQESKHGIAFSANRDNMNLTSSKWVVGEDYSAAPTCATCHMSATRNQSVTHNVGLRIKWNNRPPVSKLSHETDVIWGLTSANIKADKRKENMIDVCVACHNRNFVDNFYIQYEALLDLYNDKYAKPGAQLYAAATEVIKAIKGTAYANFAQSIDYTWFELWHHEGRRARHAASMQGPDYTHWHGTYELAKHWYGKYIPELNQLIEEGRTVPQAKTATEKLERLLAEVLADANHKWSIGKEDRQTVEQRDKRRQEFLNRYK